ncbi:hypothetical protein MOE50_04810 [Bacillus inaquosorum]|uniref:hypothetical protein n=1 Tax=Bacillus inaquosorum TaxID=483913 RepID=UPI0022830C01|nr:hypothetical protein [Bacillus inaquosorum]MCY9008322.1 hypothetical protein [Bacillus inaquosorum]MCY9038107.1 hypothetical protein [Bacillus inaquosorum]MCY9043862.1 hypothetical protein [Bacillus inaquosorum]
MRTLKEQEKALELLDDLIDAGIDVTKLRKELDGNKKFKYNSVKEKLRRGFGSIENALKAYGLHDPICSPTRLELERCLYIAEDYRIAENKHKSDELKELYNISDIQFKKYIQDIKPDLEIEALEVYVEDTFPEGVRRDYIRENKLWHIETYIRKYFSGSAKQLCEEWGLSYEIFNYSFRSAHPHCRFYLSKGFEFERLVSKALKLLYPDSVEVQKIVGNCRPDFVISGKNWVDAKLSKGTVYGPGVKTIKKYLEHTDNLTIIYARDDECINETEGVTFLSACQLISDLRKKGRYEVAAEMEDFLIDLDKRINDLSKEDGAA